MQGTSFPGIAASRRQLSTVVDSESDLMYSTAFDGVIELSRNITISETVTISERDSLTINGNGFAIDGDMIVRCLSISKSVVYLMDLIITNCYLAKNSIDGGGGGLIIDFSVLSMERCIVFGNVANQSQGGGLFAYSSNVSIVESYVANNRAVLYIC